MKYKSIVDELKESGYITGRSTDICVPATPDVFKGDEYFVNDEPSDHENVAISCDPQYYDKISPFNLLNGPFSLFDRCLNGKSMINHVLDYGRLFY